MHRSTRTTLTTVALLGVLMTVPGAAWAQAGSGTSVNPAVRTDDSPSGTGPAAGANSFTEGQAQSRMEDAGFREVTGLQKDELGIWRGRATRNGTPFDVALDFKGEVFSGSGAAAGASTSRDSTVGTPPGTAAGRAMDRTVGATTTGAHPGGSRPDGASGNPPSTAVGRAVDRAQGQAPQPDATPGNPPGTAAGRAIDRTLGTNSTGGNPAATSPAR